MFAKHKIDWRFVLIGLHTFLLTVTAVWMIGFWLTIFVQYPNPNRELFAATLATSETLVGGPFYFVLVLFMIVVPWYRLRIRTEK